MDQVFEKKDFRGFKEPSGSPVISGCTHSTAVSLNTAPAAVGRVLVATFRFLAAY